MQTQAFYREIETALEFAPGAIKTGDEPLKDLGKWDSMALLSFIALVDELFSEEVEPSALGACKTPRALAELCKAHLEG